MTTPTILESKKKEFEVQLEEFLKCIASKEEDGGYWGHDTNVGDLREDKDKLWQYIITNFQPKNEKR